MALQSGNCAVDILHDAGMFDTDEALRGDVIEWTVVWVIGCHSEHRDVS